MSGLFADTSKQRGCESRWCDEDRSLLRYTAASKKANGEWPMVKTDAVASGGHDDTFHAGDEWAVGRGPGGLAVTIFNWKSFGETGYKVFIIDRHTQAKIADK